ncbi:Peptidyl-prolyl cis-trans isomerase, cyclophilin type [Trichormus variabilis ATCC 29413]|uniref:Peptidyl-prolyl cis-trans isomerase n=2 Tax=Anabaena variabilis TaxID=264691 RepID=Q3MDS2_TRIV2|nr:MULTISPECIES: peptidylprolyl isomerase [Nostocaceae]ABA20864.1 Peptidyl-prolyl cis-trans isomerase, cyclophilin type [Trichormus variabilis ATCC 29413]MBC1217479.1 peptidylprolyl isomerase [Trichormus variabilis ARAD]MBC1255893.1 peptidylprolyl isomerase [Trichormus variabilis V5]MBC1266596.1 peptidylprolyl isomerase [Trichormus variabilis FSR]MBC1302980.1 peptidylprolyl isomerase [Trichormus variabilis N2B]
MRLKFSQFLVAFLIIGSLILGGCSAQEVSLNSSPGSTAVETTTTTAEATSVSETNSESNSGMTNSLPRLEGKATVVITVKGSPITVEVDGTNAPITAGNFIDLVQKGVYDNTVFHRVVRQPQPFVVQGGDPQSKDPKSSQQLWGTGGYIDPKTGTERRIPLEIKPKGEAEPLYGKTFESARVMVAPELQHKQGAVAMARSQQPDSASSQFYFALADLGFLDGNYAVFGQVTQGFDVVNKIQQGDRIDSAKVTQGAENLKAAQ